MTSVLKQTLQLRRVAIDTYKENVAYLHRDCHIYRSEGFQALSKVEVNGEGGSQPVLAVLNVVDDDGITTPEQLGLSEDAFEQLGLAEGAAASVAHARPPASLHAIHRKIAGQRLDYPDYEAITRDIVEHRYSKIEMAAFLVACTEAGMERDEVLHLTRAMAASGERLATFQVGVEPEGVAASPDGRWAYRTTLADDDAAIRIFNPRSLQTHSETDSFHRP